MAGKLAKRFASDEAPVARGPRSPHRPAMGLLKPAPALTTKKNRRRMVAVAASLIQTADSAGKVSEEQLPCRGRS